ncbi:hypothetical protein PS15p_200190 [Mucor circinelloides]
MQNATNPSLDLDVYIQSSQTEVSEQRTWNTDTFSWKKNYTLITQRHETDISRRKADDSINKPQTSKALYSFEEAKNKEYNVALDRVIVKPKSIVQRLKRRLLKASTAPEDTVKMNTSRPPEQIIVYRAVGG